LQKFWYLIKLGRILKNATNVNCSLSLSARKFGDIYVI